MIQGQRTIVLMIDDGADGKAQPQGRPKVDYTTQGNVNGTIDDKIADKSDYSIKLFSLRLCAWRLTRPL